MGELRFNPVTRTWAIISPERGQHRYAYVTKDKLAEVPCPFCDKNGGINTKLRSIYTINLPESSAPALIVTPNRYPAMGIEGLLVREDKGMYDSISGIGAHEVVIDSFRHNVDISGYTEDELNNLYTAFRDRIADLEKDVRFRYVAAFKKIGVGAGEIINHPHAQIIAMPIVPDKVRNYMHDAVSYYKDKERCMYCDIIKQEKNEKSRIIFENYEFIAFAPYASSYPFEISIYPKKHESCFSTISEGSIRQLADITKEMFSRLSQVLGNPALTLTLRLAPYVNNRPDFQDEYKYYRQAFHYHIDIRPVVANLTGSNWAANICINPVSPEDAAKHLREVNQV